MDVDSDAWRGDSLRQTKVRTDDFDVWPTGGRASAGAPFIAA